MLNEEHPVTLKRGDSLNIRHSTFDIRYSPGSVPVRAGLGQVLVPRQLASDAAVEPVKFGLAPEDVLPAGDDARAPQDDDGHAGVLAAEHPAVVAPRLVPEALPEARLAHLLKRRRGGASGLARIGAGHRRGGDVAHK